MLDVSAAYTAAIKDKNRTDRITGTIKLCDGETINITDDIIVNNSVTLKEQLVSGDTFEIGTFYTNQLDITVYDDNFLTRSYANARITPKYEVQLADGSWESVPLGIFTVDNSLTKRRGSIHKLTAFDDSTKFDVDISAYSGGKKTVQQHIKDLAADVGITLATTDFSSYPNYNLIVDSTASSAVQTYRDLIEWCCALMAASARINRYGKLEIVKLKEKKKTVDGVLVYDADYTVEGYERTGTEFFDLRALTKYFSTTFDGEQYVYANNSTLEDTVARKATLFLPENPLLQSVADDERKTAFEACADTINIALRRVEFSFNGNPAIECFDTLCGNGGKIDVNRTIAFFPTSLVWKYRGAHKVSCAFAELTDEATVSASEAATLAADEATATKVPVQIKSKTEKRLDGVGKTASEAGGVGKFTNTDKNCEIFNDYENNVASSYYAHAEGYKTTANAPYSHAEGRETIASNEYAHAEGREGKASGAYSHAEGGFTQAIGTGSHAEGYYTVAGGDFSHVSGVGTQAGNGVFAIGRWNKTTGGALLVIGNGWNATPGNESTAHRSDAMVLDDSGNLHIAGKLTADGGTESGGEGGKGYVLPTATRYTLGGVMIGDNLLVSENGVIAADLSECAKFDDLPSIASATKAGLIKVGDNLEISEDGTLSVVKSGTFPPATKTTLGGVIVGSGLGVNSDGKLYVNTGDGFTVDSNGKIILDLPYGNSQQAGIVRIGSGIRLQTGGLISVPKASKQAIGLVKPGEGIDIDTDGTISTNTYPPASLFLSGASKMMLHKYVPVETKKQGYYYGSVASDIICDTTKYYSRVPEFPESYIVVPNWYSSTSASATVTRNATFELTKPTVNNDSTFTVKVVCKELNFSSNSYTASSFYNTTIYLKWKSINAPTSKFPYGYIDCEARLYYCDTSGTPQNKLLKMGYIPFASKAEYNAAICLTATELPTFDLSEEKYTLLVPNSLCLLSGELPQKSLAEEGVIYLTPNESNTAFKQYMWNGTEYKYLGETDRSTDLSKYLRSDEISDWAKTKSKPAYTADEVGAAEKKHSHSISDITDMPTKLPANGGNADTVDGKHASDFAAAKHTHTAVEVGAATSADITAAISAVEIGGRNLLYNSRFDKKYPTGWAYSTDIDYAFDDEVTTLTKAETASRHFTTQASVSNGVVVANPNLVPENGCTYTISCEVMKAEGYDVGEGTKVTVRYNYNDNTVKDFDVDVSGASETAWKKYSRTFVYSSEKELNYTQFIVALGAQACGIRIRNVKFEKGNKSTGWTPAPEDDERRIESLEARVAALEAMAVSGGEV